MEHMKFETSDMVTENIDKIAALFPSTITEMRGEDGEIKRGVNFEVLKQLLSRDEMCIRDRPTPFDRSRAVPAAEHSTARGDYLPSAQC